MKREFNNKKSDWLKKTFAAAIATTLTIGTVQAATFTSTGSGNWGDSSIWSQSGVDLIPFPNADDTVIISAGHNVAMDFNQGARNLTINGTLSFPPATNFTLTIDGGSFTNNGSVVTNGVGTVHFINTNVAGGTGLINGSSNTTFQNVTLQSGSISFSTAGNVAGTLRINSGGWIAPNPPTYLNGSTLIYSSGGFFPVGNEWQTSATSGAGVPFHVRGTNNTTINFGGTTLPRHMNGNLLIDSGAAMRLSANPGGNLSIRGDFVNNGTFRALARTVTFNGSGLQVIGGSQPITFNFLNIDNNPITGSVRLDRDIDIEPTAAEHSAITNNGNFNANFRTVRFRGKGSSEINGTRPTTFYNVIVEGLNPTNAINVRFQDMTTLNRATIANSITYRSGGRANKEGPFYAMGSTMFLDPQSSMTVTAEWNVLGDEITDRATPYNVTILSGDVALQTTSALLGIDANYHVLNNLTINPGATLIATGDRLSVEGNLANNGSFQANSGTVILDNGSGGALSGNFLGASAFHNLQVNKANRTVTLNANVEVDRLFSLFDGRVQTGSNHLLIDVEGIDTSTRGVSRVAGIVQGTVRRTVNGGLTGQRLFPVGTIDGFGVNEYTPLRLEITGAGSGLGYFECSVLDTDPPNMPPSMSPTSFLDRFWTLRHANFTLLPSSVLTFRYNDADFSGGMSELAAENLLVRNEGNGENTWFFGGASQFINTSTNEATAFGVDQYETFWSIMENNTLAVDMVSLRAYASGVGESVTVEWETAAEIDNAGFHVYRAQWDDRERAFKIGERLTDTLIPAAGNEFSGAVYTFTDSTPVSSVKDDRAFFVSDMELNGRETFHGPVALTINVATNVADWTKY